MKNEYLAHYGIKGMKWGVWNDETRAKRMGGTGRKKRVSALTGGVAAKSKLAYMQSLEDSKPIKQKYAKAESALISLTKNPELAFDPKWRKKYESVLKEPAKGKSEKTAKRVKNGKSYARRLLSSNSASTGGVAAKSKLALMESNARAKDISKKASSTKKTLSGKGDLSSRFDAAKAKNPNLSYSKIYKEMGVNMKTADASDYKKAEDAWLKKHGF